MPDVLVRGITEETHESLKRRAKEHGRSMNAEMLAVLDATVEPKKRVGLGTELQEWKKKYFADILVEEPDLRLEIVRDRTPARGVDFSGPEYDWADSE